MVNQEFWQDKRVLVTGHAGFKGSWLCLWLAQMQANILGFGMTTTSFNTVFPEHGNTPHFTFIEEDIRNAEALAKIAAEFQPDIVIHLAAQSLVLSSYENPVDTYSTNVMGTLYVLEAIRHTESVKAGLIISSDKCYLNTGSLWGMREIDPLGGDDPYSSSKACVEILTHSYRRSFFANPAKRRVSIASARAGNVIGGGDWSANRLIPDCIRSWQNGEEVVIRSPNATRPWQHVLDVLHGYLMLMEHMVKTPLEASEPWNIGPMPHESRPVRWIVETLGTLWGNNAQWRVDTVPRPKEAPTLTLDSTKARRLLGWTPRLNLQETMEWTVEWYKRYQEDPRQIQHWSQTQIERFQNL